MQPNTNLSYIRSIFCFPALSNIWVFRRHGTPVLLCHKESCILHLRGSVMIGFALSSVHDSPQARGPPLSNLLCT